MSRTDDITEFLREGDTDLARNAAERAVYSPRGKGDVAVRLHVVACPAPLVYQLQGVGGAVITCTRKVHVSRAQFGATVPRPGDKIKLADGVAYEIAAVETSACDPSYHFDLGITS